MKELFQKTKEYTIEHERRIGTFALIAGAIFDWITITKPDSLFGMISLSSYMVMAGGCILLLNARSAREKESPWLMILLQFCFGNLASGLLILYSQSATLVGSWLFLLVLAGFLVGNEFARKRYTMLRAHLIGLYILLSAYVGFMVPILLKKVGTEIFIFGSLLSLVLMVGYVALVFASAPSRVKGDWKGGVLGILITAGVFNALYFFNFIPPVPLTLSEISIFHSIVRTAGGYQVSGEASPRIYDLRAQLSPRFNIKGGEGAFCFSSVYAPVGLTAPIYHRFEQYDEKDGVWKTRSRIAFPISGGRDNGYRGYSFKSALEEGRWRCSVETENGALIGRKTFMVSYVRDVPVLITETR